MGAWLRFYLHSFARVKLRREEGYAAAEASFQPALPALCAPGPPPRPCMYG